MQQISLRLKALSDCRIVRLTSLSAFYLAQGMPIGFFLISVTAWLGENDLDAARIAGFVATISLPWSLKFPLAFVIDRYAYLPMGRRKVWLIAAHFIMLAGSATGAALAPSSQDLSTLAVVGLLISLGATLQDTAIDGLAVEILPPGERGTASALMFGSRSLGIAGGALLGGALLDRLGAGHAFLAITPLNGIFLMASVLIREREGEKLLPWTKGSASSFWHSTQTLTMWALLNIFARSFVRRRSLIFVAANIFGRIAAGAMIALWPILAVNQAGYTTTTYSTMAAFIGLTSAVVCMVIGPILVSRLGAQNGPILAFSGFAVICLCLLVAPDVVRLSGVFAGLTLYWLLTDTLSSISTDPLRMQLCATPVAATQFAAYNSVSNLAMPLGASIFALANHEGGYTILLISIIALTMICCLTFTLLSFDTQRNELPG